MGDYLCDKYNFGAKIQMSLFVEFLPQWLNNKF